MRKKALLAVLMAAVLLLSGCTLIVKDQAVDDATEIIRMGDQVITKAKVKEEIQNQLESMAYMYSMYGYSYDTTDPDNIADAQASFIAEKGGLDAEVVSRGQNFSGGQQQRMLLARALAGNPDILILDDASSALDFKTEAALRAALRAGYGNATTVIIAQRISAVMQCDQILVMEDGEPKGLGTHQELMQSCSLYREIAQLQLGGEQDE